MELYLKIQKQDIDFVKQQLKKKENWSDERINNAIKRYQQFLYLTTQETLSICPTKDVDTVWHCHILNTKEYYDFCFNLFGKIIHHKPFSSQEEKEASNALHLSDVGPIYFEEDYPKPTDEMVSRECCTDDSECCTGTVRIKVE